MKKLRRLTIKHVSLLFLDDNLMQGLEGIDCKLTTDKIIGKVVNADFDAFPGG